MLLGHTLTGSYYYYALSSKKNNFLKKEIRLINSNIHEMKHLKKKFI